MWYCGEYFCCKDFIYGNVYIGIGENNCIRRTHRAAQSVQTSNRIRIHLRVIACNCRMIWRYIHCQPLLVCYIGGYWCSFPMSPSKTCIQQFKLLNSRIDSIIAKLYFRFILFFFIGDITMVYATHLQPIGIFKQRIYYDWNVCSFVHLDARLYLCVV